MRITPKILLAASLTTVVVLSLFAAITYHLQRQLETENLGCLLYTSDAADDM
jgi:hypothetical protein